MKRLWLKFFAIFTVCLTAAGCGPMYRNMDRSPIETAKNVNDPKQEQPKEQQGRYDKASSGNAHTTAGKLPASTLAYVVGETDFTVTVGSDEEIMELSNTLMDYAESGKHVCVGCTSANDTLARNTFITFSSTSKVEVTYWVSNMIRRGYAVTIDYDKETGVYSCTAYRKVTP